MGTMTTFGQGPGQGRGYLARPRLDQAPAVLLFHAWWGLNTFMQELATRISDEGYVVLAPDYMGGRVASTLEEAKELASGLERKVAYALAGHALERLLADDTVAPKEVAVIGFSLGVGPALEMVRKRPDAVRAAVVFYGTAGGKFGSARANFQGHFAEVDDWGAGAGRVAALEQRLAESGGRIEFYTYAGTGHWFFESNRPEAFREQAAAQAWQRTLRFLREEIG